MIQVRQVSHSRNGAAVLTGIDASVGPGGLLQVEGANGSGKTTLLRIMSGLIDPEEGSVTWKDRPIGDSDSGFRGDFAYIGHKPGLKPDLTALENLEVHASLSGGDEATDPAGALAGVGADGLADSMCSALSAGQRRRVSLARLLLRRVSLWLLDEPYANVDADGAGMLTAMISRHLEEGGMAVVTALRPVDWGGIEADTLRIGGG